MSYIEFIEDNPFEVRILDPKTVRLFRTSPDDATVRLTLENERSWRDVRIARAFPFSDPDCYVGLRDGDDKDIGLIVNADAIDGDSQKIVRDELERRYFTPKVLRVYDVEEEFRVVEWDVETDRGRRQFVVRNIRDNAYPIGPSRLMVTDTDGNRYEFPEPMSLGPKAYQVLAKVM